MCLLTDCPAWEMGGAGAGHRMPMFFLGVHQSDKAFCPSGGGAGVGPVRIRSIMSLYVEGNIRKGEYKCVLYQQCLPDSVL